MDAAPPRSRLRPPALASWAAFALAAAGCGSSPVVNVPTGRPVVLADFARAPPSSEAAGGTPAAPSPELQPDAGLPGTWAGQPELRLVLQPAQVGVPVLVESLVGQINGKPIFADGFLEPLEDRLLRKAEEASGRELDRQFHEIINESLREVVRNELMLAAAEASLTEQQRMGLFALLDRMYQEQLRLGGGTQSGAEERALRSGSGLQEYMGTQREALLIRNLIGEKVMPLVIVSWRDVEREYQRHYAEFNAPATVTLARIRLDRTTEAAQVEDVTRRLEAGEAFAKIAQGLGLPDGGRWETFTMGPGGITDIEVSPEIKRALEGLDEGQTSKPLTMGSSSVWLNIAAVRKARARSIYDQDVQLALVRWVRQARYDVEFERFVRSLQAKGIYDDLDKMANRIYAIAILRYSR